MGATPGIQLSMGMAVKKVVYIERVPVVVQSQTLKWFCNSQVYMMSPGWRNLEWGQRRTPRRDCQGPVMLWVLTQNSSACTITHCTHARTGRVSSLGWSSSCQFSRLIYYVNEMGKQFPVSETGDMKGTEQISPVSREE